MKPLTPPNALTRLLVVTFVLVGQVGLSAQTFALASCHTSGDADPPGIHAAHGGHSASAGTRPGGVETTSERSERHSAPSCHCVAGMHCGQVAVLLLDNQLASTNAEQLSAYPPTPLRQTVAAHRRKPDRPPPH